MEDFYNQNNIDYAQEMPKFFNNNNYNNSYNNIIEQSSNYSQDFTSFSNEKNIYLDNNINFIDTPFVNIIPDITFNISFTTSEKFTFSDNPNNLFQTTFDKFFQEKNLEHLKNNVKFVVHNGKIVDFNKTLSENDIKDNSNILIMFYPPEENQLNNINTPPNINYNININTPPNINNNININTPSNINNNININTPPNINNNNQILSKGFSFYGSISKTGKNKNGEYKINQDLPIVLLSIGNINGFNIFGVLDGHGSQGHLVSQFCKDYFTKKFEEFALECKSENIYTPEEIYNKLSLTNFQYIIDLFKNADIEMKNQNIFDYNYSGTTCNLVIQLNKNLICANVGDSRAILVYDDDTNTNQGIYLLSEDHIPESPQEYQRIINSYGMVDKYTDQYGNKLGSFRVYKYGESPTYRGLGISRSLGDMAIKSYGVTSEPQIKEYKINHNTKFLVICSDGVWKHLSNEDVRNLGNVYYEYMDINSFCSNLMVDACNKWAQNTRRDDITIVSVFF